MTGEQHRYWRGVLLYSICEYLEIPKDNYEKASARIHKAIRRCFGVDSFKHLSTSEFEKIAATVRMLFIRELGGWILPEADEEGFDANKATMKEFLAFKKLI